MIEDTTAREIRVPHEPDQIKHENGATGVAGITVLVRDVDRSTEEYEAILGTARQPLRSASNEESFGSILALGETWIQLSQPGSRAEEEHHERYGQGPYKITLRRHGRKVSAGAGLLLESALFSGARIALA